MFELWRLQRTKKIPKSTTVLSIKSEPLHTEGLGSSNNLTMYGTSFERVNVFAPKLKIAERTRLMIILNNKKYIITNTS